MEMQNEMLDMELCSEELLGAEETETFWPHEIITEQNTFDTRESILSDDVPNCTAADVAIESMLNVLDHRGCAVVDYSGVQSPPDNIACPLFDVLGTEEAWQGKRWLCSLGHRASSRGVLLLMTWPVSNILRHVFLSCGISKLYMLAMTCRSFRDIALRLIEEHAQEEVTRLFFNDKQLHKFVDMFGCFSWALGLKQKMTATTLSVWDCRELDAAYEFLTQKLQIDEVSHLHGLKPMQAMCWKVSGRRALEDFMRDCITGDCCWRKVLFHYNKAWKMISDIFVANARVVKDMEFRGRSSVRRLVPSWPSVMMHVYCPIEHDSGVWSWTAQDVYQWFRIKKFPVSGLYDMNLDGAELVRLCTLAETCTKHTNVFLLRPPGGLGMSVAQFNRVKWLMHNHMLVDRGVPVLKTITFHLGEKKAS
jgi:hypothetical protein